MKTLRCLLLFAMFTLLGACGGGGSGGGTPVTPGTPVKTVTLKVSTVNDPLASFPVKGVTITITLPIGVTAGVNPVTVSGVASPGTLLQAPVFTAASGATNATLQFQLATGLPAGFNVGEFATVVLNYSGTATLVSGDFPVASYTLINESLPAPSLVIGAKAVVTGVTQ